MPHATYTAPDPGLGCHATEADLEPRATATADEMRMADAARELRMPAWAEEKLLAAFANGPRTLADLAGYLDEPRYRTLDWLYQLEADGHLRAGNWDRVWDLRK